MRFLWRKKRSYTYEYYYNRYPSKIKEGLRPSDIRFVERVLAICRDAGIGIGPEEIWEALLRRNSSIDASIEKDVLDWICQLRDFVMESKEAYPSGLSKFFKRKDDYEI